MSMFIFRGYEFDEQKRIAHFHYGFDDGRTFTEKVHFLVSDDEYDKAVLQRTLLLAFYIIGTSYYKTFSTREVQLLHGVLDEWQARFLNYVYQEGMSQFAFENKLTRDDLAHFSKAGEARQVAKEYDGNGTLALQSGGKDSLLMAELLQQKQQAFTPFYISSTKLYPEVLNQLGSKVVLAQRVIDSKTIRQAIADGGKNGHIPVTYVVLSIALIQAVLLNKRTILSAIGHEGEEPQAWIGDLPVNHQWSKTWPAEQLFIEYVKSYISPDIQIGSPLRKYSELKIAELFVENAWQKFGHSFSSCNRANYEQGADNTALKWCGECPKCANAFLLFAPFLKADELKSLFNGQDLFAKSILVEIFKGLLGIDGAMKPFECVGEIDELRVAYHMALEKGGYETLPFEVPTSQFDYNKEYPYQVDLLVK